MKRENGFSLIELLVAMAILVVIAAAAVGALVQAQHVTQAVALQANAQQNLRAGMHSLVHDLMQAGEGIPTAGITIPTTAGNVSAITRPGPAPLPALFPTTFAALPQVIPGWRLGMDAKTVNPVTLAVQDGLLRTDIITVLYADDTLVSSALGPGGIPNPKLSDYPVVQAAPAAPVCAGILNVAGTSVTLAPACFTLPGGPVPISKGDLIMFHNANGSALELVTNVAGNVLTFAAGDPAGLNGTGLPNGTVTQLNVGVTPTSISRVWMVTYYVDSNTVPSRPQLIRQLNYPNYPSVAAPTYPAQPVADIVENLSFSYDLVNSTAAAGTYPLGPGDAPQPVLPDTSFNIRAVNVTLAARSEYPYAAVSSPQYFRNNLNSQVSVRSMAFVNAFPTPATLP
ncbi:MAG: prepilin-type N-terminal cleavage/methylation domain-containing protein [Candidatus Acidiferrales bacterium]